MNEGSAETERTGRADDEAGESQRVTIILARGNPSTHPVAFLWKLTLRHSKKDSSTCISNVIAQENPTPFYQFDLDQSAAALRQEFDTINSDLDDPATQKDSTAIKNKIESGLQTEDLIENLEKNPGSENSNRIRDALAEFLREHVFPGMEDRIEVTVKREQSPGESQGENQAWEPRRQQSPDDNHLHVQPLINPSAGISIDQCEPGDLFKVRIVGESVQKLKSEFIDKSVDGKKSIPIASELESLRKIDQRLLNFVVDLGDEIKGKGESTRQTKIKRLNETDSADPPEIILLTAIGIISLLVSVAIMSFIFPGLILYLLPGVG